MKWKPRASTTPAPSAKAGRWPPPEAWCSSPGTIDKRFRAFDSRTGKVLWQTTLDTEGHTNPMTFMGRNGKQYVVIVSSGLNAFALPPP